MFLIFRVLYIIHQNVRLCIITNNVGLKQLRDAGIVVVRATGKSKRNCTGIVEIGGIE